MPDPDNAGSPGPGRFAKHRLRSGSREAATGAALTTELLEPAVDRLRLLAAFFAAFMVLFAMANAGLPGTSGFVGEFMVIIASFKANPWFAFFAGTTLVLGAAYTLWMIKRVVYGEVANDHVAHLEDLNRREFLVLGILAIFVLLVGLWPAPLVDMMEVTIQNLVEQVGQTKY